VKQGYAVIIVGAGIMGLSTAYYLAKKGCQDILILEKEDSWIAGSTAKANGGFRQQFSTPVNVQLSQLSLSVLENFEAEFDVGITFRQFGYLFTTATESGQKTLQQNIQFQKDYGVPVEWLTANEIGRIAGYVRLDDLLGGAYCPKDGYADSYSIAAGFGKGALRMGVELHTSEPVIDVLVNKGRITGVRTKTRRLEAAAVLNAAGPYARELGRMAGTEVPIDPVRRMLIMTEDFPQISGRVPMTIDFDTSFFMRKESGRVLMGWSDPDEPAGYNCSFDPGYIEAVAEKAMIRVPVLSAAAVNPRRCWAGLYEVSPDHHPILGESHEIGGLFLANGFSGHGMMHSPAAGMILADLILEKKTDLIDVHPLRPSRFSEGDLLDEGMIV
jgi:sarcosine oxidase subunit beta